MISLIACSIKPDLARRLEENIRSTIGIACEVLICDNRGSNKGICQVYNETAAKARFDYLGFIHEDIAFHTPNWGNLLIEKLQEPTCGVIGFAGSTLKLHHVTGWYVGRKQKRCHFIQRSGSKCRRKAHNPQRELFSPVVTLDGMALFVRRSLWQEIRFDEELLRGFHGYDLDFSIAAHVKGYRNYVCQQVWIEHFSLGSFSPQWHAEALKWHKKWADAFPLSVEPLSQRQLQEYNRHIEAEGYRILMKMGLFEACDRNTIRQFTARHPLYWRSWHLWWSWWKYRKRFARRTYPPHTTTKKGPPN